tara:strand:+ start:500 stop:1534 length:1035 start_codon:yes stop_codon:yes gene_type:complete
MVTLDNIHQEKINIIKTKRETESECQKQQELQEYYLKTGEILFQYYDTIENIGKAQPVSKIQSDGILSYLHANSDDIDNKDENEDNNESEDNFARPSKSREELRREYLNQIDDNQELRKKTTVKYNVKSNICLHCKTELSHIHSEGIVECKKCGVLLTILNDTDKASYKDPPKESCYYSYRRSNHFNEWIAQFQGKETTQIPRNVLAQVVDEIKKERIKNLNELTQKKVRAILKKLKLNKYYEHIPHIINQLNGQPPPYMSRQTEELLRIMFQKIQGPFLEFCPKKRKNFLSYSYVLHKFVELLGMDHLKPLFPLLKSREKLHSQDEIWKKICEKIGWEFHKSI